MDCVALSFFPRRGQIVTPPTHTNPYSSFHCELDEPPCVSVGDQIVRYYYEVLVLSILSVRACDAARYLSVVWFKQSRPT